MFDPLDEIVHPCGLCLQYGITLVVEIGDEVEDTGSEEVDYGEVGTALVVRLFKWKNRNGRS